MGVRTVVLACALLGGCALSPKPDGDEPQATAGAAVAGAPALAGSGGGASVSGTGGSGVEAGAPPAASGAGGEPAAAGEAGSSGAAGAPEGGHGGEVCVPLTQAEACAARECGPADTECDSQTYDCGSCSDPTTFCNELGRCETSDVCSCEGRSCGVLAGCPERRVCGDLEGACSTGEYCSEVGRCYPMGTGNCEPFEGCCSAHASPICRQSFRAACDINAVDLETDEPCGTCAEENGTIVSCGTGF